MKNITQWPMALLRRWLLSAAVGGAFLLAGLVGFFALRDHILLALSLALALFTFLRCVSVYRTASSGAYETVEGVCVEVRRQPFRNQKRVRLMSLDGIEHTLMLDKQMRLRIGNHYRFYFTPSAASGVDELPTVLQPQDLLLGIEDLGEYRAEQESPNSQLYDQSTFGKE